MNILGPWGLVYDIVGAFLIARALVVAKGKILAAQALTVINGNPALFAAFDEQRNDARFGIGLLVLGFSLQLLPFLGVSVASKHWPWFAGGLVVTLVLYVVIDRWLKSTQSERFDRLKKGVKQVQELMD